MTQHRDLTEDRWRTFSLDQQILMIGNEMHRASNRLASGDREGFAKGYERVLALTDLTIRVQTKRTLRRELLRFRDLAAEMFVSDNPDMTTHRKLLRCLLYFTPTAAAQIPFLSIGR